MEKDFFRNCLKNFVWSSICGLILSVAVTGVVLGEVVVVVLAVVVVVVLAVAGGVVGTAVDTWSCLRFFFLTEFLIVFTTFSHRSTQFLSKVNINAGTYQLLIELNNYQKKRRNICNTVFLDARKYNKNTKKQKSFMKLGKEIKKRVCRTCFFSL